LVDSITMASTNIDVGPDNERREQGAQCRFGWVRGEGSTI
jgi:hypothetical protein